MCVCVAQVQNILHLTQKRIGQKFKRKAKDSEKLTMHACKDLAKIAGRSHQNPNPFPSHREDSHCILWIRLCKKPKHIRSNT